MSEKSSNVRVSESDVLFIDLFNFLKNSEAAFLKGVELSIGVDTDENPAILLRNKDKKLLAYITVREYGSGTEIYIRVSDMSSRTTKAWIIIKNIKFNVLSSTEENQIISFLSNEF